MFDRIAGVYDVMNSVMTVGMHQRWRERAVELARRRPGVAGARRGDRHRRPGGRAARSAGARGGRAATSPRRCSSARARKAPSVRFEWANALDAALRGRLVRRRDRRLRRAQLLRPVARASPRWRASCAPAGAWSCSRSRRRSKPPLSSFFSLWFDRAVPALGRLAGDEDAYTYLPSSVKRFPGPEALAGELADAGLEDVRWILTAGGIIAIHAGTVVAVTTGQHARRSWRTCSRRRARSCRAT